MTLSKKVFCVHRSVDKAEVKAFASRLVEQGIEPWLDEWEIAPGKDVVQRLNEGLAGCDVAIVFLSSKQGEGQWFEHEVRTLTWESVATGTNIIPVLLDDDVQVPRLLLSRARRRIEDFGQIIDAIHGTSRKPPLGPTTASRPTTRFTLRLVGPRDGFIDLIALRDGNEVAREMSVRLSRTLLQSYAEFLQGETKVAARGPAEAAPQLLEEALGKLGNALGTVLFPNGIGTEFLRCMRDVGGPLVELCFEASDMTLLALPFEATRIQDVVPALEPGVCVRRIVVGARPFATAAPASPLKILIAVGAPDEGRSANAVLDLERELQGILDAVADRVSNGNVQVRFLEIGHPSEIGAALARDEYHVLHLSGHGDPGTIELEDEDGAPVTVTAKELADELKRSGRNIPLVFLSSCHGGTASNNTTSLAVGLIREGVPLVLSMQTRVTDRYAAELARIFYEELARREFPLASQALASARQRLEAARLKAARKQAHGVETQPEYATASLFGSEVEPRIVDYTVDRVPLKERPVHQLDGPVPQLRIGELVGRRRELRALLRALRDPKDNLAELGSTQGGIVLTGIGGVGKSSLAGRAMVRLKEDGWVIAAVTGRLSLVDLTERLGEELVRHPGPDGRLEKDRKMFADPKLDDEMRRCAITRLLQTERVLLVLDNFEDNLTVGGDAYLDETTPVLIEEWAHSAQRGRLLLTSRYPLPGSAILAHQSLGALSPAESRKLFLRLPGLRERTQDELKDVMRHIGGHPRMLEYLDAILRRGRGRFKNVTGRLRRLAADTAISLKAAPSTLDEAVEHAILIGARDILLDELVQIAEESGDTEVLFQCAVSSLPIDATGVAHALADQTPNAALIRDTENRLERLVALSLITGVNEREFWVHRWTANALQLKQPTNHHQEKCRRAGRYRIARQDATGNCSVIDGREATRNFFDGAALDEAATLALSISRFLVSEQQLSTATAFAGECLLRLPKDHRGWTSLANLEAKGLQELGFSQRALDRYEHILELNELRFASDRDGTDSQRELFSTYAQLGKLLLTIGAGERAGACFEKAHAIAERLVAAEPDRSEDQRRHHNSCYLLGLWRRARGDYENARVLFQQALAIAERLAPESPESQHDLFICYEALAGLSLTDHVRFSQKAIAIVEDLVLRHPDRTDFKVDLCLSYNKLGANSLSAGDLEQAQGLFEKALVVAEWLVLAEPERTDFQHNLCACYVFLGNLMRARRRPERTRSLLERSVAVAEHLVLVEPERADFQRDRAYAYMSLGGLMHDIGEAEEARTLLAKSVAITEELARAEPERADLRLDLVAAGRGFATADERRRSPPRGQIG